MLVSYPIDLDPILASLSPDRADPRVLPHRDPWLSVFQPRSDQVQVPWRCHDLIAALASCQNQPDAYMSQGFFTRPNRRAINLFGLSHCWVDLDYYNATGWLAAWLAETSAANPDQVAALALEKCRELGIPPTTIQSSGRGLYIKWSLSNLVPLAGAARLRAVNRKLVDLFSDFGADNAACDVSRVLRVPGSINLKNNQPCRTIHVGLHADGRPLSYHFGEFCDEILPLSLHELRELKTDRKAESNKWAKEHKRVGRPINRADWACQVVSDLTCLANCRWSGIVPTGYRDEWTWLAAAHLALWLKPGEIEAEVEELLAIWSIEPDFIRKNRNLASVIDRANRAAKGQKTTFMGQERSPLYRFSKETLIQRLEIDPEEMSNLSALINTPEKYRRHKIARDKKTESKRIEKKSNRQIAISLINAGADLKTIAENCCVNIRTIRRWRQKMLKSESTK